MKNTHQENARLQARQYHRHHSFSFGRGGVSTNHEYEPQLQLTWWQDFEFVMNNRRVMLWWIHPRMKYADVIDELAWNEAGEPPCGADDFDFGKTIWKPVGRSRKRIVVYQSPPIDSARTAYYEKFHGIDARLRAEGIESVVSPFMAATQTNWCTGIDLCIPVEIRCHDDAIAMVELTRKLLKRETTIDDAFPNYRFGRTEWIAEAPAREIDAKKSSGES